MPDNMQDRGPQDRSRISLEQEHEVRYWTDKFGISKPQLEEAVKAVGPSAKAVEDELRRQTLAQGKA